MDFKSPYSMQFFMFKLQAVTTFQTALEIAKVDFLECNPSPQKPKKQADICITKTLYKVIVKSQYVRQNPAQPHVYCPNSQLLSFPALIILDIGMINSLGN